MSETDAIKLGGADARALTGLNPANPVPSDKQGMENDVTPSKPSETTDPADAPTAAANRPRRRPPPSDVVWQHEAAPADTEIELKLVVDPDRLAEFNRTPIIADNARSKGSRKHFKTVYYDTPERKLRREGLTLRVRQSGTRFTQTVKTECSDDPLTRGEWEASVPSIMADFRSEASPRGLDSARPSKRHAIYADRENGMQRRSAHPRRVGSERAVHHGRRRAGSPLHPGQAARRSRTARARLHVGHPPASAPCRSAVGHSRGRLRPRPVESGRAHAARGRDRT